VIEHLAAAQTTALYAASTQRRQLQATQHEEQTQRQQTAATHAAWQEEKRAMKSVCKLALAVTMDRVALGGAAATAHTSSTNSPNKDVNLTASAVVEELEASIQDSHPAMQRLGLDKVWTSLKQLAYTGTKSKDALTECRRLCTERDALNLRCVDLEEAVREIEEAAGQWQRRAVTAETAAVDAAASLESLTSSVRWASGDFAAREHESRPMDDTAVHQLNHGVKAVTTAVGRLLRKHKTLTRVLLSKCKKT
jgi:hypothetical protein